MLGGGSTQFFQARRTASQSWTRTPSMTLSDEHVIPNDDRSNRTIAPIASFAAKFENFAHDDIVAFGVGISHCGRLLLILLPVSPPRPEKMGLRIVCEVMRLSASLAASS
jgi:hypothetical protein